MFDLIQKGGIIGLLLVIIVGGVRQWWVFGWAYKDLQADRDEWKVLAGKVSDVAHKGSEAARGSTETARDTASVLEQAIQILERERRP